MAPVESRFVQTGNYRTHYLHSGGEGAPLVLVHGAAPGANAEYSWKEVLPSFGERFDTYAIDLLGFGQSDKPNLDYTFQRFVEQIEEFIESMGLRGINILGNSVGAYVAVRFALDHPEKVRRIVAIASTILAAALGVPYKPTSAVKTLVEYDGSREAMKRMLDNLVYNKSRVTDEGVDSRNRTANSPGAKEAMASLNSFMKLSRENELFRQSFDIRSRLSTFKVPLLIIWGENDSFAPIEIGHGVKAVLPMARFASVKEAGHQCMVDQPNEVARLVVDFLSA